MPRVQATQRGSGPKEFEVLLSVDVGAYAAGDQLGEKTEVFNIVTYPGQGGVITNVTCTDLLHTTPIELDILVFRSDPSGTFTDNSPVDPDDSQVGKLAGSIHIATTSWKVFADSAYARWPDSADDQMNGLQFTCESTSLWLVFVIRTIKTPASASDFRFRFTVETYP